MSAIDIIAGHNYPVETHTVTTNDGYILSNFRIPSSERCTNNERKPIVLINHGMTGSADTALLNGPNDGLPYMLADACYDVWLSNCRGTRYSRKHVNLRASLFKFWYFSWHEIGMEDLPALIDHILSTTKQKALHFVGHSQGTTSLMVMLSMRPEYNENIKTANLLAPPIFMKNSLSLGHKLLKPVLSILPDCELGPHHKVLNTVISSMCQVFGIKELCTALYLYSSGRVSQHMNRSIIPLLLATHPAGISTRQPKHYFQLKDSGRFRQYDFGRAKNWLTYNRFSPPDYPLENVRTLSPIHLYYSDDDGTIAPADVSTLASELPNSVVHHIMERTWDHMDFILASSVKSMINEPVMKVISDFEQQSRIERRGK
ncbi:lipase 3 [Drosophila eugracilis]|uniref:lipase 3 n=1 Tax=Drosophila eugracilis TaxID=29029 RepID=UPI0007E6CA1C|nr:lipase 3 [Drosophila eugracilis]